ncbi:MAG TPA: SdiA-regulated domain-containing protein [Paludibacter sp.]|nr:SdiA-regulated domain-containing protein [Paludibacter sp.]
MKLHLLVLAAWAATSYCCGQLAWPTNAWGTATNLSAFLPPNTTELSGLFWNEHTNRLYCVGDGGTVYVLQYTPGTMQYRLWGTATGLGGSEGVTQVDKAAGEFYIIDEDNYEIRRFTYNPDFSAVTKANAWKLLDTPMPDTGNIGPEGIAFVPDWYLQRINFVSSLDGQPYLSTRGMGGLMFLAHQNGGYIWVYDLNPRVDDDLVFVGKYKTGRAESCDLSFDYSTGMLYILHNIDENYLEVTNLSTTFTEGEYKFNTTNEYYLANPPGDVNVEGFAIAPKFPTEDAMGAWLCRDVSTYPETADAIRWFNPFAVDGPDILAGLDNNQGERTVSAFPNPAVEKLTINVAGIGQPSRLTICNSSGQTIQTLAPACFPCVVPTQQLPAGLYILKVEFQETGQPVFLKFTKL